MCHLQTRQTQLANIFERKLSLPLIDINGLDMAATRSVSVMSLRILDGARFIKHDEAFLVEDVELVGDQGGSKKKIRDPGSDFFLTRHRDQLTNYGGNIFPK